MGQEQITRKCFIFAIGGTGSRVLRSLTHLLASGVTPKDNPKVKFEIIPIIIDPHSDNNQELSRTEKLLMYYKEVKKRSNAKGFFDMDIKTLKDVNSSSGISPSFAFKLGGANVTFKDYIGYSSMSLASKALTNLLFSGTSKNSEGNECDLLDINMGIGFVGNPNVGSVVLNQLKDSKPYEAFAGAIKKDDRIFIISSIFGGTGAAGFPCLLKNIRDGQDAGCASKNFLREAPIGAVTVLPYFKLQNDEKSPICYADFIAKTKSALYYYKDNVTGENSHLVNMMYYIGDTPEGLYKNDPGHNGQKNKAHFVELASALAIIDFLNEKDDSDHLKSEVIGGPDGSGKATAPICKQFYIKNVNSTKLKFTDFHEKHNKLLATHLSQFALFRKYMVEPNGFDSRVGKKAGWSKIKVSIDASFKTDTFYTDFLGEVFDDFAKWMNELAENERGFDPLNMNLDWRLLIKDKPITSVLGFGENIYDEFLNKYVEDNNTSKEEKLLSIFYNATKDIVKKKYNIK